MNEQLAALAAILGLGFSAGLALAIPLGPMAIMLLQTATTRGPRHASVGALAMASVDGTYAAAAAIAGSLVLTVLEAWRLPLTIVGGVILLTIGALTLARNLGRLRGAAAAVNERQLAAGSLGKTFGTFAAATAVNPPTALYFLAITPGIAQVAGAAAAGGAAEPGASGWANGLVFCLGVFIGSLLWQMLLALGGSALRRLFTPRAQAITGLVGGALIILMAAGLIWNALVKA